MLWKILIFIGTVVAALIIFGRGAKRGEAKVKREAKRAADKVNSETKTTQAPARPEAQDLSPCPRCGAYVADPAACDCKDPGPPTRTDLQQ